MCGIAGFTWEDEQLGQKMSGCISHRGPDARGIFAEVGVTLAHARLSVLDLSEEANQPMVSNNGRYVMIYNGEIYNFKELRDELEGKYQFRTKGDTEVILAGYKIWGTAVVERLRGMFALAIWDKEEKTLFLARDHAGIKPLYYWCEGGELVFSSEIKAILEHGMERRLNLDSLNRYMRILYSPEPETLIKGIYKLPPSHTLLWKGGEVEISQYGLEEKVNSFSSHEEAKVAVRDEVMSAVGRQLVADVPVGVYLSGGIDSSVVLFSASQYMNDVRTFSVGFELSESEERSKFNKDFELAARTAEFYSARHTTLMVSAKDALDNIEQAIAHNDDLVSNPTSLPMMLLAKKAKQDVSVVLSGNGGDELFGGYDRYRYAVIADYYRRIPSFIRKAGSHLPKVGKLEYESKVDMFAKFMFEKDAKISKVLNDEFFQTDILVKSFFEKRYLLDSSDSLAECLMRVDQRSWLPDQAFNLSDKMAMAHGLEERVPLVDERVVALARSLPRDYKVDMLSSKKVLKDAFKEDLPEYLFNQPKRGWFSPGAKWLRGPLFAPFVREVLSPDYYSETKQLFNWVALTEMLESHVDKSEYNLTLLWAVLSFQIWARHYKVTI